MGTLGKLPEPWWSAFENHQLWFNEDGKPKARRLQQVLLPAEKTSIKQKLASIGNHGDWEVDGQMMEPHGTRLDEIEIQILGDLLEKMLHYRPEDRITISKVISHRSHPWFALK